MGIFEHGNWPLYVEGWVFKNNGYLTTISFYCFSTGQKGIGFKSVFRVTNRPEIHSNNFHWCFDIASGPMGYILPHWIPVEERTAKDVKLTAGTS